VRLETPQERLATSPVATARNSRNFNSSFRGKIRLFVGVSSAQEVLVPTRYEDVAILVGQFSHFEFKPPPPFVEEAQATPAQERPPAAEINRVNNNKVCSNNLFF